jgi:shikimate dehydrogenase
MVYWTNRTPTRLECPFSSFSPQLVKIPWEEEELRQTGKVADLIVNATSLGWRTDDELPWLGDVLTKEKTYFDLNYAAGSRLLTVARASGATVFDGTELLLRQGMEGFRLVTGRDPPERAMRQSLADRLGSGS